MASKMPECVICGLRLYPKQTEFVFVTQQFIDYILSTSNGTKKLLITTETFIEICQECYGRYRVDEYEP